MEIQVNFIGLTQFSLGKEAEILEEIDRVKGTLLRPTISLCHQCHYHIPAYRYELDGSVYICKRCSMHGLSHHMIERDSYFYHNLKKTKKIDLWNFDHGILTEVTDRCNIQCPHCYHLPDNQTTDQPLEEVMKRVSDYPPSINTVALCGAEASLRKDFIELASSIISTGKSCTVLTNGIKFSDLDWVKSIASSGARNLDAHIGLNHPGYLNNTTIRAKQVAGIENIAEHLLLGYVGYTMVTLDELDYILTEIATSSWPATHFRIRCGSQIGRNSTPEPVFVSDIYKRIMKWANDRHLSFKKVEADNNIYHQVVDLGGKLIRVIHWCDERNIDMEELRSGPWNDFVPDGITNFLNQIIRRDIWKNKSLILPDKPPVRYHVDHQNDIDPIFDRNYH